MDQIRQVWSHNFHEEITNLCFYLHDFPIVTIDTEFPGLILTTQMKPSELEIYTALQFNISRMNMFQLGLTVSDENGRVGRTWEFNFKGFKEFENLRIISSFLEKKNKKFDFEKMKMEGIDPNIFAKYFLTICSSGQISKWVTYHGAYDIGYLLKMLLGLRILPDSIQKFMVIARDVLGNVSDIKHMATHCDSLFNGKIGLQKMARLLDVKRIGDAHHGGSDSLLTASIYAAMKKKFELPIDKCEGYLYGLSSRITVAPPAKNYEKICELCDVTVNKCAIYGDISPGGVRIEAC